jgi:tetratricopeptide (TPR) repeat protein
MRSFVLLVTLLIPSVALACLWDYDTLRQERARFPSALELMTGKFLRHSPEFYQWRIRDRLARLEQSPTDLSLMDDLAVAYHKVGDNQAAIELTQKMFMLSSDRYETLANMGTFYILDGQLAKGLEVINRALEINPDAHFGRERYQKWLVEYALSRFPDGNLRFPLNEHSYGGFARFLKKEIPDWDLKENQKAVKAVLGMMRFANHDNPLLLEALGDLLMAQDEDTRSGDGNPADAKALAVRAYLLAARQTKDESAEAYRNSAKSAACMQVVTRVGVEAFPEIEKRLEVELADAQAWYDELAARERDWIDSGADVEAEYDRLYHSEPESPDDGMEPRLSYSARNSLLGYAIIAGLIALIVALFAIGFFFIWLVNRGKPPVPPSAVP